MFHFARREHVYSDTIWRWEANERDCYAGNLAAAQDLKAASVLCKQMDIWDVLIGFQLIQLTHGCQFSLV